jgi:hypothetical protein
MLSKQASPPAKWLDMAREDLATAYSATNRPADAERFRPAPATSRP